MSKKIKKVKAKSTLTKFQQFKLRMELLGLVFLKNLSTILWSALLVCMILALTGVIDETTPVLKYIFGSLSIEIKEIVNSSGGSMDIVNATGKALSLISVTSLCSMKLKRLALADIHSKKIKLLLIRAGMYFDENGKLTRRMETITNLDIDNDGKIGNTPKESIPEKNESIIKGLARAGEEFVNVIKVDLNDVKSENVDDVYKTVGLDETKEGIDEISTSVKSDTKKLLIVSPEDSNEEISKKINIWTKLWNKLKNFINDIKIKSDMTKLPSENKESVNKENKSSSAALSDFLKEATVNKSKTEEVEIVETKKEKELPKLFKKDEKKEPAKEVEKTSSYTNINNNSSNLNDFLKNLRK